MRAASLILLASVFSLAGCVNLTETTDTTKSAAPVPTLKAKLVVNQDTYALPTGGKMLDEYRKYVEATNSGLGNMPTPPAVDLVFEITNTGDKDLDMTVARGFELELKGPGVVKRHQFAMNCMPPPSQRIKAGETFKVPIKQLTFFADEKSQYLFWTKPGEYELSVTYTTSAGTEPIAPNKPWGQITLTSSAKLKVVEGKDGAPFPRPGERDPVARPAVPAKTQPNSN